MKFTCDDILALGRAKLIGAVLVVLASVGVASASPDPTKTVGPDACAECHKAETQVWKGTHHFSTFTELPRTKEAPQIAEAMGIKRIKADSDCLGCHFTSTIENGAPSAVAGISCESCHGAGKGYNKVHSEFSGKKKETETADEQAKRWAAAEAAGMIRPSNTYELAKNCYSCHMVPNEKLVNVGGHKAGSDFDLVAWSQGEVRHNTWYTADKSNRPATIEHKRLFFVVGSAVELETVLAATGKATVKDTYAVSMAKRAKAAKERIAALAAALPSVPELKTIAAVADGAGLRLNNEAELTAASQKVGEATKKLAASYDGKSWGAIDGMLPPPDKYQGKAAP